ncbi:RagB/SusD family nutrient uptake outer membrane protein [Olivibacter jilunii]|uniref:RagB/SusD family nutrient uptake outer membrane protein n=1 Tax=Olivibacter jilunii TaxID=985016 RepID=UPI003F15CD94
MKVIHTLCLPIALWMFFSSCSKERLELKPNSSIVTLSTVEDLQHLLDNAQVTNVTGALSQLSSDEYFIVDDKAFDGLNRQTQRNAYVWAPDLYEGEEEPSWNNLYTAVFYANSVLDAMEAKDFDHSDREAENNLKGSALFIRAYSFHDLVRSFAPVYNTSTAARDLGIPLRLSSGIDEIKLRASVDESYRQILADLSVARGLLSNDTSPIYKNRPSLASVFALYARVYLDMGDYLLAGRYADSCLMINHELIDYNTIDIASQYPFHDTGSEVIYFSEQVNAYTTGYTNRYQGTFGMDSLLVSLYASNDLRLPIFFERNSLGNYSIKRGYTRGLYAFTGLAWDEVLLIKAECAARLGDVESAEQLLNELLQKRYRRGTFTLPVFNNADELLTYVLTERRKELVWRGLRWQDIKRLNREGRNIQLSRVIKGQTYTLQPNDPRYVFPIPDNEISLSGIEQNRR